MWGYPPFHSIRVFEPFLRRSKIQYYGTVLSTDERMFNGVQTDFLQGKSFLHLYLCSVAEGGEPRMVMTDRKNTPLAKRIIMSCVIS